MDWSERVEVDPGRLGGKPVVRGSRIPVEIVVGMVADGWSEERSATSYPSLSGEDVRACLHYAAAVPLGKEKQLRLPAV